MMFRFESLPLAFGVMLLFTVPIAFVGLAIFFTSRKTGSK
jgi:hypothetical protein